MVVVFGGGRVSVEKMKFAAFFTHSISIFSSIVRKKKKHLIISKQPNKNATESLRDNSLAIDQFHSSTN